jgi:hypothetical protein
VSVQSKVRVCRRLITWIAISHPAEVMDVRIFFFFCVLCRQRPLRRADHSFSGVLWYVSPIVRDLITLKRGGLGPISAVATEEQENVIFG